MKLFRGINLEYNEEARRRLGATLKTGIPADWTFDGYPGVLAKHGFLDCSIFHTVYNFKSNDQFLKKHFCSFSSELSVAQGFAQKNDENGYYLTVKEPSEDLIESARHVIFVFDSTNKVAQQKEAGIFIQEYNQGHNKVGIFDVHTYVSLERSRRSDTAPTSFTKKEKSSWNKTLEGLDTAINLSSHEKEWYIFSLDHQSNTGKPQTPDDFSSIIFSGEVLEFMFFMPLDEVHENRT